MNESVGEIIAKGPNVMKGYYENEEATKNVLKNGWFYTGDLGYMDKDGYFYISGRDKNVIVLKNGKNIYPEELEILVSNLPYVAENMVFGLPKDDDLLLSVKIVYNKEYVKENYPDLSEEEKQLVIQNAYESVAANEGIIPDWVVDLGIKNIVWNDHTSIDTTALEVATYFGLNK